MRKIWFAAPIAIALGAMTTAQEPVRDLKCAALVKLRDGKFTHAEMPNYSVLSAVRLPGSFDLKVKGLVGIACIRTSLIPILEDVEVLQAGYNLHIGSRGKLIKLALDKRRVQYTVNDGSPSADELKAIDEMIARMQLILDSGKPPQP